MTPERREDIDRHGHQRHDRYLTAATTIAHSNGNTIIGAILQLASFKQFKDDSISGFPENALSAAGALVHGTSITNHITITSASATFTLANGIYTGELCRIRMDRTCTKLATIDPAGSTTIDGSLTRIMWAGETALLSWNGTEWNKIAGKSIPMIADLNALPMLRPLQHRPILNVTMKRS